MADFTNVEVTDTFDQWRIKTNQLGSDFIAFEAQVEEDIANIDLTGLAPLSHTHPINDIINLQSSLDSKANQSTTYTKTETDAKYVTLSTAQSVTGDKTFTKSLTASGGISSSSINITDKLTISSGKMRLRNQDYTWPSSYTAGRYLSTDAQGNLSWEEVAGGTGDVNLSTLVFNDIVPVGTIIPWAATSLPADEKWKFCNGEEVSNTTYPQISELLGNRYGTAASGKTKLPNFAGRVPLGAGGAFSVGGTGGSANITGTTADHTLTIDQMPRHYHNTGFAAAANFERGGVGVYGVTQEDVPGQAITGDRGAGFAANYQTITSETGGNQAGGTQAHSHNISLTGANYQPYLTTQYIIKVLPDDVQQVSIDAGNGINVKNASNQDTTTLDLFSTKIELKTDPSQFKFSSSGLLQLVTPVVSQASITTQINNAVSGLATEAYVDTAINSSAITGLLSIPLSKNYPSYYIQGTVISGSMTGVWSGTGNKSNETIIISLKNLSTGSTIVASFYSLSSNFVSSGDNFSVTRTFTRANYTIPTSGLYQLETSSNFTTTSGATATPPA